MLYIDKITNDPQQQITLTGIPETQISMTLRFMPRIQRWIMGVSWGTFSAQGIAVVTSLNLLQQWENVIPFGISCVRGDGLDPYTVNDFSEKRSALYLLNSDDVAQIKTDFFT